MQGFLVIVGTITCVLAGVAIVLLGAFHFVKKEKSRLENIIDISSGLVIIISGLYFLGSVLVQ